MSRVEITSVSTPINDGVLQTDNPLDGNLQVVKDQDGNSSTLLLATDETQVNSTLRVHTDSSELLDLEDNGSNNRFNINRDVQKINLDFASNPSGLTNQVGAIRTYQDEINLSDAMSFIKDGSIGIGTNAPLGLLHLKRAAATTRMVIDGDAAQSKIITYRTNGLQRFGLYTNNTPESGANVGSDFQIRAYSDAGALLSTPFFIKRSTGNIGIGTTLPTRSLSVQGDGARIKDLNIGVTNSTTIGNTSNIIANWGNSGIGIRSGGVLTPTALFQIQGSGATSATTSLLVQNSAGTSALTVRDDLNVIVGGGLTTSTNATIGTFMSVGTLVVGNTSPRIYNGNTTNANLSINPTGVVVSTSSYSTSTASAVLEAKSTTQGFLPPRMTTAEKNAIVAPASGLVVYDTTLNKLCVFGVATWETIQSI